MKNIDALFEQCEKLPAIPQVVRELILSFNDVDVDTRKIAAKIALDQVISARVLRAANSARFGVSRRIASLGDAMLLMGFNAVRTLVIASGLAGAVKAPPGFDLKAYWKHCAATAGYAGWLARRLGLREDFAYTGGLMLHIGILLIRQELPGVADGIEKEVAAGTGRVIAEEKALGYNHADVGAELARRWNFPPEITQAFQVYPRPLEQAEFVPLAGVFYLADLIATLQLANVDKDDLKAGLPVELTSRLAADVDELAAALPGVSEISGAFDALLG
ncbi:HDOD domain-containing protein [Methylococcus sp. EFPC2]|uniref:HDOD domain-containing protein n=1 Tax=Methylococcus sp. EFPC2 TaxID=2812648 RepID=UPI001967FC85|nr:HDOD domain-containing protein [Methylococcus sp. EFPC2]QSA95570.1 HDOD domain-containing protein [Methylococcus sp. EFPC2]